MQKLARKKIDLYNIAVINNPTKIPIIFSLVINIPYGGSIGIRIRINIVFIGSSRGTRTHHFRPYERQRQNLVLEQLVKFQHCIIKFPMMVRT
jgi:hypothetical protein